MADSAIGIDRSIDTTGYSPVVGDNRAGGDRTPRLGILSGEASPSPQDHLAALIRAGTAKLESGAESEAIECFRRALDFGDQTLGAGNPDLMLILNDLTRLYLKQSRYGEAEPLLLRLLEMKRSKGEDHPEVATVLASLASVQQSLGRHEAAEQLWRRVLDIRERTLAPNHFAIATALEHLGDTCAARGNIREALPAFQRALTIRERTLGDGHPSVRTSRERIADLQLQSADDSVDLLPSPAALASPDRFRLHSGDQLRLSSPAPMIREPVAPPREPVNSANKQTRVIFEIPSAEEARPEVPVADSRRDQAVAVSANPSAYRDVLESIRDELDQPAAPRAFGTKVAPLIEAVSDLVGKRRVVAGAVVTGVLAVLLLAVTKNHAWGELQQAPVVGAATAKQPQADHLQASTASALSLPVRDPAVSANAASRVPAPRVVATKPRVEERVAGKKAEEPSKTDSKKFSLPTIASSLMSHLDSVVSKAGTAPREDNFNVQPTAIAFGSQHLAADEQATVPLRARLIGELPTPRIPQQATDVEGEVRVRFTVDAQGQPVMSTFAVVTSPHPLLTAAVRRVVPEMRFDPARSGGADGRAIADVVETSFRFARASR